MTPAGYMAKRIERSPDWLEEGRIVDIYSVAFAFRMISLPTT